MCGLTGSITKLGAELSPQKKNQRARILQALLQANESRGKDSTGVAAVGAGAYDVVKKAVKASSFIKLPETQRILRNDYEILLGHTRAATTGAVSDDNAHPFVEGRILGTHNGVIWNHKEIDDQVNVDSQVVFRLLDKKGNSYTKAFPEIRGSCTLAWVDLKKAQTVHLVSHTNPLYLALSEALNTYFWSSQEEHLRTALTSMFGVDYKCWKLDEDFVYSIDSLKFGLEKEQVTFKTFSLSQGGGTGPLYSSSYDKEPIKSLNDRFADDYGYGEYGTTPEAKYTKEYFHREIADSRFRGRPFRRIGEHDLLENVDEAMVMMSAKRNGCTALECNQRRIKDKFWYDEKTKLYLCYNCHNRNKYKKVGELKSIKSFMRARGLYIPPKRELILAETIKLKEEEVDLQ